ncbi:MAG TPA: hypothetical protein VF226_18050 [Hyphomicrobiaceae bacterium]
MFKARTLRSPGIYVIRRRWFARAGRDCVTGWGMPIEEQTLIAAIMDVRGQVDFLWQFFMTVQIAIFALLFIYDEAVEQLNSFAKFLAIGAVALFDWINSEALKGAYTLLDALHRQYRADFGQPERFQSVLYDHFVLANFEGRVTMITITHSLAFGVVLMALLWRRFIQNGEPKNKAATGA